MARDVKLPAGYFLEWGGQFENLERSQKRLALVVPLTLALIFVLLWFSLKKLRDVLIIYTGIPLAAVGGVFAPAPAAGRRHRGRRCRRFSADGPLQRRRRRGAASPGNGRHRRGPDFDDPDPLCSAGALPLAGKKEEKGIMLASATIHLLQKD